MSIAVIIEQTGKLFLILCLGVLLAHVGILDVHTKQRLTKLLLTVATPMMMIDAFHDRMLMAAEQSSTQDISVGMLFLISFGFYIVLTVLSVLLVFCMRIPKADRRLYLFMTIFGNIGFMGFPIVQSVYGTEAVFYGAILNSVFNIIVYTFGVVLMGSGTDNTKKAIPWRKLLLTPAVICTAVGVVIFVCKIRLPAMLADTCDTLGGLTSPLAMLVVGANLHGMKLKEVLTDMRLNLYVLLRQMLLPLIFWAIVHPVVTHPVLAPTLLLMACMPVANTTALFATEYGGNERLASQGIFLTTLCSLISFPLIIFLAKA